MNRKCQQSLLGAVIGLFCLLGPLSHTEAGEPLDKIRTTINDVLVILSNKALLAPERQEERRQKIRQTVLQRFGFEEMARRALGRHWREINATQQKEFVPLFSDLLERSYINKIESYGSSSDLKILYTKETVDSDGYAMVRSEVVNEKDLNFEIEYRLLKRGGNWEAYDIVIEGVSLVNNYRTQFNKIISQESYTALVKKLKLKLEQEEAVQQSKG